jgi:hypothetical protein
VLLQKSLQENCKETSKEKSSQEKEIVCLVCFALTKGILPNFKSLA